MKANIPQPTIPLIKAQRLINAALTRCSMNSSMLTRLNEPQQNPTPLDP